jgi:plastocyanin
MMMGYGWGSGWLGALAGLLFMVGVVFVAVWAIRALTVTRSEDDALALLRARFARGEIDAAQFEEARRVLGEPQPRGAGERSIGLIGVVLIVAALVVWFLGAAVGYGPGWGGPGGGWRMGPWMMGGGYGPGPSAPAGTSVRMRGSQFSPPTLTITAGETVRWFNDDDLPHTVTATDRSWDSGNLPPGASYERRFDAPGTYSYLCVYHPGMTGTIEVRAP